MSLEEKIRRQIRDVPNFPKEGIVFKDITPVLHDGALFKEITDFFAERYRKLSVDLVVGIESRGFVMGAPIATALGVGFVPVRKQGKLPYQSVEYSYDLEYGSATIEMHVDAVHKGQNVVILDDLLATGGTADAACKLVRGEGANIIECAFLIELSFLKGREKLKDQNIFSLIQY